MTGANNPKPTVPGFGIIYPHHAILAQGSIKLMLNWWQQTSSKDGSAGNTATGALAVFRSFCPTLFSGPNNQMTNRAQQSQSPAFISNHFCLVYPRRFIGMVDMVNRTQLPSSYELQKVHQQQTSAAACAAACRTTNFQPWKEAK